METIRSLYHTQEEILSAIIRLHCLQGFDCDCTYGNGAFYRGGIKRPKIFYDLAPLHDFVFAADSRMLPMQPKAIRSIVFDPPFLTYVRQQKTGNGKMAMARRYSGYWRYDELEEHYRDSISEFYRVLKPGGLVIFKCQDIIHNHRMHCTHARVINWAETEGFRLRDLFVLAANSRMPSPNRKGAQKHARIFHSYFLVLERDSG